MITEQWFIETDREIWFQELADVISNAASKGLPCDFDYDRVATMPIQTRAVFHVWWFYCEAGCSGIEGFLLQDAGLHTKEVLEGLSLIGADVLAERLQAAIPLSIEWEPEYTGLEDWSWFKQFVVNPVYPTIDTIDSSDTFELLGDDLRDKANSYIDANRNLFVSN